MDEKRNDEILDTPLEETVPEVDAAPAEIDSLEAELEDIKEMFQRELDAAAENEEPTELIQSLEDINEDEDMHAETEEEESICECCGENPCSKDFGEGYPYCDSCRELMKRYPLRFSGILTVIIMIAVFAVSVYSSSPYLDTMLSLAESAQQYDEGKVLSAMYGYYSYVQSANKETISRKALNDLLDGFLVTGYFSDAEAVIDNFYDEDDLSKPWNKKYADIKKNTTALIDTYYAVNDAAEPVLAGKEFDYDEIIAKLDALKEINPIEEGKSETTEKYNELFIEYYKFVVMNVENLPLEEQLNQLKYIDSINDGGMEWAYLSNYCAMAAKTGDEELTKKLFDRALKINKEDMNAYLAYASYYRFKEEPDADKILEICEMAKENAYGGDVSYKQYTAIAYMLKGEGALALEEMNSFMSNTSYTVQKCNLYALCALYNGNKDIYNQMKETLEDAGYELSEIVEKYKAEKISITEALQDMGGDI